MTPPPDLDRVLRERFGFPSFRAGQREAIEALLRGERLLCIQPTGHGKSLLYQMPAALLEGITLVISPLLALMRDQIDHLNRRFGLPAVSINSDQSDEQNLAAQRAAASGQARILFVAPEQLDRIDRARFVAALPVSLVVIDEAHCVSTWGHDFRPAYRQITATLAALTRRRPTRVLALTATADERTEQDIRAQLEGVGGPLSVHRRSMDRPNIALDVRPVRGFDQKLAWLAEQLPRLERPGLLYCATRDNTEVVAEYLAQAGLEVAAYHAGMAPERKRALQAGFLRGDFRAIAATNALGMGIDKSDLRYVVHVDVPGSITAYYQEVGRSGRDGQPARGVLLFDPDDLRIQTYFIQAAQPSPDDFQRVLDAVERLTWAGTPPRIGQLRAASGLHPTRVTVVVAELVEQGFLAKRSEARRQVYERIDRPGDPALERYRRQEIVRRQALERMTAYARGELGCLMRALRVNLGDRDAGPCGRCSACDPAAALQAPGAPSGASGWLQRRPVVVPGYRSDLLPGRALYDSHRRSPAFRRFMGDRASPQHVEIPSPVLDRLCELAADLAGDAAALVCLPSRTWCQREATARALAGALGVPLFLDDLRWQAEPPSRQGALLNNDQRRQNVAGRLGWSGRPLPEGTLLLLDDYTGSGATLRAAAHVLRKEARASGQLEAAIVPLTVARVRWRLGQPGIV